MLSVKSVWYGLGTQEMAMRDRYRVIFSMIEIESRELSNAGKLDDAAKLRAEEMRDEAYNLLIAELNSFEKTSR